jgi:hypothetical protein
MMRNGKPVIGFGEELERIPPLELRTAYTVKGLGIGAGGLVGYMLGGPLGMVGLGFAGWALGNHMAVKAEREYGRRA